MATPFDGAAQRAFCAEPLGDGPVQRVETGPDGETELWHFDWAKENAEANEEGGST